MKKMYLIRHGRTAMTEKLAYCGMTDEPLDAVGIEQGNNLRERMKVEHIDLVVSSDLMRASEFANIVFPGREIGLFAALREMNFGLFEGMTHEEILVNHYDAYRDWMEDPEGALIPEGEHVLVFKARVREFLIELMEGDPEQTVAVVAHGGPISVMLGDVITAGDTWGVMVKPASISIIDFADEVPRVELLDDVSYLEEESTDKSGTNGKK